MDLSYSDEPREDGGILIRGRLKHLPGGHYEDSFMPAPLDTTGGKSHVQAVGSTNHCAPNATPQSRARHRRSLADHREQPLKARTADARTRAAKIVIDDRHICPADSASPLGEVILTSPALMIVGKLVVDCRM
jgi:hypothetical protein